MGDLQKEESPMIGMRGGDVKKVKHQSHRQNIHVPPYSLLHREAMFSPEKSQYAEERSSFPTQSTFTERLGHNSGITEAES